jgi:hypothetical protein
VLAVILAVLWLGRPRKKRPLTDAAGGHKVVALSVAGRLRLRPRGTVRPARAGINSGSVLIIWPKSRCGPAAENDGGYKAGRQNAPCRNADRKRSRLRVVRRVRADFIGACPKHDPHRRRPYSKP